MGRQYKEDDPSTSSNLLKRDVIFWRREETLQPKSTTAAQSWPEALTKCRPKTDHELADDTRHTSTIYRLLLQLPTVSTRTTQTRVAGHGENLDIGANNGRFKRHVGNKNSKIVFSFDSATSWSRVSSV